MVNQSLGLHDRGVGACNGTTYGAVGVTHGSIAQPGVILITLFPPSDRRDLWGVGTVYVCTLTYPLRFMTWGTRGDVFLGTHAQAFLLNKRSK